MTKKLFIILSTLCALLFFSTSCFATDGLANGVNNIGNEIKGSLEKTGNSIQNGVNHVTGTTNNNLRNDNNVRTSTTNTDGYTATRTSTNPTFLGMNSTMWTWFVFAILAIVIVALVWYYGMQNSNNRSSNDD